ncbi:MAG: VCBS repeat-containing protein, partial [Deltaproteobacteria bacterium]
MRIVCVLYCAFAAVWLLAVPAHALQVSCHVDGDGVGWAVAAGYDFDGDGTEDLASSGPCAFIAGNWTVGRVIVYSGANGKKLLHLMGSQEKQRFGSALSFIGDLSGDGLPDLMVGSYGWDVVDPSDSDTVLRSRAGKIEVFDRTGNVVLTMEGAFEDGHWGESLAALGDVNDDGWADFVVGAGQDLVAGNKRGVAYLISGVDGSVIDITEGDRDGDYWGSVIAPAGDLNDDGIVDVLVASGMTDFTNQEDLGRVKLFSGDFTRLFSGPWGDNKDDHFGKAVAGLAAVTSSGKPGLAIGVPGGDPNDVNKAGLVEVRMWKGGYVSTITEPTPVALAQFGLAVASVGDIDGDGLTDFVASAPKATVGDEEISQAGRVHLIDAGDGVPIWTHKGRLPMMHLGRSLTLTHDWDGDGINDVAVGAPGAAPRGRMGAGSVEILSGADGSRIRSLGGLRGAETRIIVAGWQHGRRTAMRSFNYRGRRRELRRRLFRGMRSGEVSMAVLDPGYSTRPRPGQLKLVVSAGHDSGKQQVLFFEVGRRGRRIRNQSLTLPEDWVGGANVAAGQLIFGVPGFELIVVQSDSDNSSVRTVSAAVYDQPFEDGQWRRVATFDAFDPATSSNQNPGGANVAIGQVVSGGVHEIVVGAMQGSAEVRIFDFNTSAGGAGANLRVSFDAYGQNWAGVNLAVGDLNGDGQWEIVTAPVVGKPLIRAFNGDGTTF